MSMDMNDIWDDATNAVCQATQENKMCNCHDGECLAAKVEPSEQDQQRWNARATPSADPLAGLVRFAYLVTRKGGRKLEQNIHGEYVLHSEAAAVITKMQKKISALASALTDQTNDFISMSERAEAAEAELAHWKGEATRKKQCVEQLQEEIAQIKAQEPVLWGTFDTKDEDGYLIEPFFYRNKELVDIYATKFKNGLERNNKGTVTALYAAPVSDSLKAEHIERELDGYIQHFREQTRIAPVHVTKALSELKNRLLSVLNVESSHDKG